ncbi:MAG: hypothetical protein JW734_06900 [Candidatus Omnitrophica bacterium]|nr:hypothetical protein [Candidatus Omnitrophota bacterium]
MDAKSLNQSKTAQAVKLVFAVLILPILIGFVRGLVEQISRLEPYCWKSLYWGVAGYLLFHIFLIEPLKFYKRTQRFIQIIFGFFLPLFKVAYYLVPFWALVVIGSYAVLGKVFKIEGLEVLFFFLSGFIFTMHIVMVAKLLKVDELRKLIDYLFIIFIVLIINIFFFSANLKLYEPGFSVAQVGKEGLDLGVGLAKAIFDQLFVP